MVGYHGDQGPVHIEERIISPLADIFVTAAQELGFKALDTNGASNEGKGCIIWYMIHNGMSSKS